MGRFFFFILFIKNFFALNFISYKKIIKILKENQLQKKNKIKSSYLFELQIHSTMMCLLNYIFSYFFQRKSKIIYFYYSKLDQKFNNKLFKIIFFRFFKFLTEKKIRIINFYNQGNHLSLQEAEKIFKKIKTKDKLNKLKYKNYLIGKYIYQSYCRELMKETVDLKDLQLIKFVKEAIDYINYLEKFFKFNSIDKIFISHTVFIRYGLICQVGKKFGCQIRIIYPGDKIGLLNRIRILKIGPELLQSERCWLFKKDFKKLQNKKKSINISKSDLKKRIYGNVISKKLSLGSLPYDKSKIIKINSSKEKIVILPSCFFDSANFFRFSLYVDNYEWLDALLKQAQKTKFEWYIKPHPDGKPKNEKVLNEFKLKYPFLKILPRETSNLTFKYNNFKSMFTFRGSAVGEFAYLGIPSVCVSDNIHINYDFGKPVKNKKRFLYLVRNANRLRSFKNINDIYEFNYMFAFDKSRDWVTANFFGDEKAKKIQTFNLSQNIFSEYQRLVFILNNIKYKHLKIFKYLAKNI